MLLKQRKTSGINHTHKKITLAVSNSHHYRELPYKVWPQDGPTSSPNLPNNTLQRSGMWCSNTI